MGARLFGGKHGAQTGQPLRGSRPSWWPRNSASRLAQEEVRWRHLPRGRAGAGHWLTGQRFLSQARSMPGTVRSSCFHPLTRGRGAGFPPILDEAEEVPQVTQLVGGRACLPVQATALTTPECAPLIPFRPPIVPPVVGGLAQGSWDTELNKTRCLSQRSWPLKVNREPISILVLTLTEDAHSSDSRQGAADSALGSPGGLPGGGSPGAEP